MKLDTCTKCQAKLCRIPTRFLCDKKHWPISNEAILNGYLGWKVAHQIELLPEDDLFECFEILTSNKINAYEAPTIDEATNLVCLNCTDLVCFARNCDKVATHSLSRNYGRGSDSIIADALFCFNHFLDYYNDYNVRNPQLLPVAIAWLFIIIYFIKIGIFYVMRSLLRHQDFINLLDDIVSYTIIIIGILSCIGSITFIRRCHIWVIKNIELRSQKSEQLNVVWKKLDWYIRNLAVGGYDISTNRKSKNVR